MTTSAEPADVELVAETLKGNRDAFSRIVFRYQSLVCALAFSATGNLAQSQDLAQETFIAAWRNLRNLRQPEKLRSWLCGIARNLVNNSVRDDRTEPTHFGENIDHLANVAAPEPLPDEGAITRDEEELLWRALEQIPAMYREPLVLFYREGASVGNVAAALELSEDAVKQRLSRGRKMLSEQMAVFVEEVLRQSAPTRTFTMAVLAALPALPATASAATVTAAVAKGSGAAKVFSFSTVVAALLGPLIGIAGAWLGVRASLQNARSEEERALIRRQTRKTMITVIGFLIILLSLTLPAPLKSQPILYASLQIGLWTAYTMVILLLIYRHKAQLRSVRAAGPRIESKTAEFFEYRSSVRFLGLPLIHVKSGRTPADVHSVARGWIAIGDTAVGLIALGGIAFGGLAIGGLSSGLIGIGGISLGLFAFGGLGFGWWVAAGVGVGIYGFGGTIMAWKIAVGGVAVAREFAVGQIASALHANDPVARAAADNYFFSAAKTATMAALLLVWLPVTVVIWQAMRMLHAQKR